MKHKKFDYAEVSVPASYRGSDAPSIQRIVDLIHNKKLSGWRLIKAKKFKLDNKTGFYRQKLIAFRRPKQK